MTSTPLISSTAMVVRPMAVFPRSHAVSHAKCSSHASWRGRKSRVTAPLVGFSPAMFGPLRRLQPTLISYLREYEEGDWPGVLEDRYYRPSSALEPFWQCLVCSFKAAPVANAKSAVVRIETLTGIRLSESQCRRAMKKMSMSLKKTAPLPGKADGQLQFAFHPRERKPRLQEASEGKCKVFFVDAAHFVLGAFLGMVWCFARPFIKTVPGRQRNSVLGAIDSHSKELISIKTTGCVHAEVVGELRARIRGGHPGNLFISCW